MVNLIIIFMSIVLVNNFLLSQFLGICSFLGVSNKMDSAVGMCGAVIFVMVLAADPAGTEQVRYRISADSCIHSGHCSSGTVRRDVHEEVHAGTSEGAGYIPSSDHHQLCDPGCDHQCNQL